MNLFMLNYMILIQDNWNQEIELIINEIDMN